MGALPFTRTFGFAFSRSLSNCHVRAVPFQFLNHSTIIFFIALQKLGAFVLMRGSHTVRAGKVQGVEAAGPLHELSRVP